MRSSPTPPFQAHQEPKRGHSNRLGLFAVVTTVAAVTTIVLFLWDAWVVNFDGGAYLVLAERLQSGLGYTFPDGSAATFRGPLYPLLFVAAWLVGPVGEKTAIWASRSVILFGSVTVAIALWTSYRRTWASIIGGISTSVQPLAFVAGAFFFVPDGLAAALATAGVALAAPAVLTARRCWKFWVAGITLGLAFLAKETALFGLLAAIIIVLTAWPMTRALVQIVRILLGWWVAISPWVIWVLWTTRRLPAPLASVTFPAAAAAYIGTAIVLIGAWFWSGRVDLWGQTHQPNRISPTKGAAALVLLALLPAATLFVVGSPSVQPAGESYDAVVGALRWEVWGPDLVGQYLTFLAILGIGAFTFPNPFEPRVFTPLALSMTGLSLTVWGSLSAFGVRNGALLIYGTGWLLGVLAADWKPPNTARWLGRAITTALAGSFLWLSLAGLTYAESTVVPRVPTWNAPPVLRAVTWLRENTAGEVVSGTPIFLNYIAFSIGDDFRPELLPIFERDRGDRWTPPETFKRQVWWAANLPRTPTPSSNVVSYAITRKFVTLISENDLLAHLKSTGARFVVVTGALQSSSPYEGGLLIPYLEKASWARRVYTSTPDELPYWIAVYAVESPPTPSAQYVPIVYVPVPAKPSEMPPNPVTTLDTEAYRSLIRDLVTADEPPGGLDRS